jgi:hypothetical protein
MRSVILGFSVPGRASPGEVALDVGEEHRHSNPAEPFRHSLQGDGFAGPGGAGHHPWRLAMPGRRKRSLPLLAIGRFAFIDGDSF